jgi:hypothetical protein
MGRQTERREKDAIAVWSVVLILAAVLIAAVRLVLGGSW